MILPMEEKSLRETQAKRFSNLTGDKRNAAAPQKSRWETAGQTERFPEICCVLVIPALFTLSKSRAGSFHLPLFHSGDAVQ